MKRSASSSGELSSLLEKPESPEPSFSRWLLVLGWTSFGVCMACYFEGWNPLTGLYVVAQIITTTGYGDVVVTRQSSKVFCSFYVLGTALIIGSFVIENADRVVSQHAGMLRKQIQIVSKRGSTPPESPRPGEPMPSPLVQQQVLTNNTQSEVVAAACLFAGFACFGTVFYGWYEACSCSYGVTAIKDCVEGPRCPHTGGAVKTWVDAFYMSLVTLTSVGFGDHSPKTRVGRGVAIVWMTMGIAATMHFCSCVGQLVLAQKKDSRRIRTVSKDLFQKIDINDDGVLSRDEFLRYALVKFGIAKEADLTEIDRLFDVIDVDLSGTVSYEEIVQHCDT